MYIRIAYFFLYIYAQQYYLYYIGSVYFICYIWISEGCKYTAADDAYLAALSYFFLLMIVTGVAWAAGTAYMGGSIKLVSQRMEWMIYPLFLGCFWSCLCPNAAAVIKKLRQVPCCLYSVILSIKLKCFIFLVPLNG